MRKKLLVLFAVLMSFVLTIPTVYGAFTYHTLVVPNNPYASPRELTLHHSSGKFIYTYYNTTDRTIYWNIYKSDGSLDAIGSQAQSGAMVTTENIALMIHELDDDEVLITFLDHRTSGRALGQTIIRLNINTFSHTQHQLVNTVANQDHHPVAVFDYAWYDGKLYYIFHDVNSGVNTLWRLYVNEFDPSTNTLTEKLESSLGTLQSSVSGGNLYIVPDPNTAEEIYFITSLQNDISRPLYYKMDLTTFAYELLATHPFDSVWGESYYIEFIKGGVEIDPNDETDLWLYFTWIYPTKTTYPTYLVIQHRMRFNVTITTTELEVQNRRYIQLTPSAYSGSGIMWCFSYMPNATYDEINTYYPYYEGTFPYNVQMAEMTIEYWFSDAYSNIHLDDTTGDLEDEIPLYYEDAYISRDATSDFCLLIRDNFAEGRIYYGLDEVEMTYDITFSHVPSDDPLQTYYSYQFTMTVTGNGRAIQRYVIRYISGLSGVAQETDVSGQVSFGYTRTVGGIVPIGLKVFEDGSEVYEEYYNYEFESTTQETPTVETFGVTTLLGITSILPVLVLLFVPSGALMVMTPSGKPLMFMIGLMVGGILCVMSGLLPSYFIFFLLLGVVIMFVFMLKQR